MKARIAGCVGAVLVSLLLAPHMLMAAQPEAGGEATESREQRLEAARQRLEQAAREVAELSLDQDMPDVLRWRTLGTGRAALGINIARQEGQRGRDEEGVPVLSVSPGGPAAAAGIRAGDVLLSVNGRSLKPENGRSPQAALLEFMSTVEPGATVAVEYRRDGRNGKVDVVAESLRPQMMAGTRVMPMPGGMGPFEGPLAGMAFLRDPDSFGGMELVTLTPKLGQYFGTEQGLLVVRAPADSRFGLEDGDVILDIAGRVPGNPAHAMRILGSYQPGEKLTFNILRQKRRVPVEIEIPADARRGDLRIQQFRQALPATPVAPGHMIFNAPVQVAPVGPLSSPDDRI